ncbi:hypothetical protein [Novosphingobium sp.]|uniref:hypothetical protein n=1 Tax=Novosphingobium sp. TaxID=1874826 RepID=UPI00333F814F
MAPFDKQFYRALAVGFLLGCAAMAISTTGIVAQSVAAVVPGHVAAGPAAR